MVGSEIWDKYHEFCSGNGKIEAECNLTLPLQYEWYLSQNFTTKPCYHRLIPYSRAPAYLQVQERAAFVARQVGIN